MAHEPIRKTTDLATYSLADRTVNSGLPIGVISNHACLMHGWTCAHAAHLPNLTFDRHRRLVGSRQFPPKLDTKANPQGYTSYRERATVGKTF